MTFDESCELDEMWSYVIKNLIIVDLLYHRPVILEKFWLMCSVGVDEVFLQLTYWSVRNQPILHGWLRAYERHLENKHEGAWYAENENRKHKYVRDKRLAENNLFLKRLLCTIW